MRDCWNIREGCDFGERKITGRIPASLWTEIGTCSSSRACTLDQTGELERVTATTNQNELRSIFWFTAAPPRVAPRIGQSLRYLNAERIANFPFRGDKISACASNG